MFLPYGFGAVFLNKILLANVEKSGMDVHGINVMHAMAIPALGMVAGLLLAFARALGEFGATLMVAGSIPGKTQTLSIAIYEAVQAGQDDTANLLVLITSIVCVAVLLSAGKLAPGRIAHR